MKNTIKDTMKDTTEVLLANGGVLGLSLSQCNDILLLISTSLAIIFTCYKFYKLSLKK
tara:strand:+ start:669 stop:842 length:174 start_codon:yes stop_codon:yes gene_type:complete